MINLHSNTEILTVTQLNRTVKQALEGHFRLVWVEGEVSNLSKPQSGHIYFTLKDQQAQVRCALFRLRNFALPAEIENGMHILVCGKVTLYEGRGDYQLIIEHLEERGEGLLRKRFELLKRKLAEEGLFETTNKQPLPNFPKQIGIITSPTGAAIRDVLSVLNRRFASIPVIIYPTLVQGEQAAGQIASAISIAAERNECDVLIICRGGGSLEDLWAFNEEIVARAIFHCKIPTVSGIGHEVDFTIADFVADQRAATPSAAAELLSPNKHEYSQRISDFNNRLKQQIAAHINNKTLILERYRKSILHPKQLLQQLAQTVDFLQIRLQKIISMRLIKENENIRLLSLRIQHLNPSKLCLENQTKLHNYLHLLKHFVFKQLSESRQKLQEVGRALQMVSPLNTLERGYSIVMKEKHVIQDISEVNLGDIIQVELHNGYLTCHVIENIPKKATK
jgi:exodeoxyribonuclease VII large subunit